MFGYGSNVTSPANFRKSADFGSQDKSFDGETRDGLTCIFKTTNTSPGPLKLQHQLADLTPLKMYQKRNSAGSIDSYSDSSGYSSNNSTKSSSELEPVIENSGDVGLKCVYQSSGNKVKTTAAPVIRSSSSDVGTYLDQRQNSSRVR